MLQTDSNPSQRLKDQERIIMNLQETVHNLHIENSVLRQCLVDHQSKHSSEHLKILSNKIKSFYNKRIAKEGLSFGILSIPEMILLLEEIFMNMDQIKDKGMELRDRRLSPALTFAPFEQLTETKLALHRISLDSNKTNTTATVDDRHLSIDLKGKIRGYKTPQPSINTTGKESKNGFFSLFKWRSSSPVKFN